MSATDWLGVLVFFGIVIGAYALGNATIKSMTGGLTLSQKMDQNRRDRRMESAILNHRLYEDSYDRVSERLNRR